MDLYTLDTLTTIFAPLSLKLIIYEQRPVRCVYLDRFVQVAIEGIDAAVLHLVNASDSANPEVTYILDLLTDIRKIKEEIDETTGKLFSMQYIYQRFDVYLHFDIIPVEVNGLQNIQAFDFLLGQYTIRPEYMSFHYLNDEDDEENLKNLSLSQHRSSNVVARGLENSGFALRKILHSSGKITGYAIRFLGKQYTHVVSTSNSSSTSKKEGTIASPPLNQNTVEKAKRHKEWASGFHSGARTATGAILYPVRWTGMQASKLARPANHGEDNRLLNGADQQRRDQQHQLRNEDGSVKSFLYDTVAGMGNGLASVCKGVTEAFTEIGNAISDSAMHHAKETRGEEYAENITKHYVEASEEIGWASYKLLNVLTFGWQGLMIDAMVEGTVLSVALYDFLIGPVILQQHMNVLQVPHTRPTLLYVVLRPWSISFYKSANDFVRKPYKIVATAMLDTRPKLRRLDDYAPDVALMITSASSATVIENNVATTSSQPRDYRHLTAVELSEADVEEIPYLEADPIDTPQTVEQRKLSTLMRDYEATRKFEGRTEAKVSGDEEEQGGEEEQEYQMMESEGINYFVKSHSNPTSNSHTPQPLRVEDHNTSGLDNFPVATAITAHDEPRSPVVAPSSPLPSSNFSYFEQEDEDDTIRSNADNGGGVLSAASAQYKRTKESIQSILYGWNGGHQSHIEICTVDCSTYLIYPPKATIDQWYEELQSSCLRVETIAKRKSGAEEFAMKRRLMKLPKKGVISIRLKRFVQYIPNHRKLLPEEMQEIEKNEKEEEAFARERLKLLNSNNDKEEVDEEEEGKGYRMRSVDSEGDDENEGIKIPLEQVHHSYFTIDDDNENEVSSASVPDAFHPPHEERKASASLNNVPIKTNAKADEYESFGNVDDEEESGMKEEMQSNPEDYFPSALDPDSLDYDHQKEKKKDKKSRFSLSKTAEKLFSSTMRSSIDVKITPVTYNGVYISNEEYQSSSSSLYTIQDHLYQLQGRLLELRNSLNAVELHHPRTKQLMQKISEHIELFTQLDQEKEVAEWEFRSWLGKEEEEEDERDKKKKKRRSRKDSIEKTLDTIAEKVDGKVNNDDDYEEDYESEREENQRNLKKKNKKFEEQNNFQFYIDSFDDQQEEHLFGERSSLLATKDCQRIEFMIHSSTLISSKRYGRGRMMMDDLRSLQEGVEHEVWIPILHHRTNQQIGNLLIGAKIQATDKDLSDLLLSEKEGLIGAGGKNETLLKKSAKEL